LKLFFLFPYICKPARKAPGQAVHKPFSDEALIVLSLHCLLPHKSPKNLVGAFYGLILDGPGGAMLIERFFILKFVPPWE
jgi:hypothetical protein